MPSSPATAPTSPGRNLRSVADDRRDSDDRHDRYEVSRSRSVRSVWVWRGFLLMALVAGGITIILAGSGKTTYAVLWGVITAGWFAIAMALWRMHSTQEEQEYRKLLGREDPPAPRRRPQGAPSPRRRNRRR